MGNLLNRFGDLLVATGIDRTRVVHSMLFLTHIYNRHIVNQVWCAWFAQEHLPARATIEVADLAPVTLIALVAIGAG